MKIKMKKYISRCEKEGNAASSLSPEKQSIKLMNLKEMLEAVQDSTVNYWNKIAEFMEGTAKEMWERLNTILRDIAYGVHVENFRAGLFYLIIFILVTWAEFFVVLWSLGTWNLGLEVYLIAFVFMCSGVLTCHFLLTKLKEDNSRIYSKVKMAVIVFSLIAIIVAGSLLAVVRGHLMETEKAIQSNTENEIVNTEIVADYYDKTSSAVIVSMALVGLCLSLIGGVTLHEAMPRILISGNVIRTHKNAKKYVKRAAYARMQADGWKYLVKLGIAAYRGKLTPDETEKQKSKLKRLCVFFLIPMLLSGSALYGKERESIIILLDLSKSMECRNYTSIVFQSNLSSVSKIINSAKEGTIIRVISIGDSFKETYTIFNAEFPLDKGYFGEHLEKARISTIRKWKELKIGPIYQNTDIISAIFVASHMFRSENENGIRRKLYLFSDMMDSVHAKIENLPVVDDQVIDRIKKQDLIPELKGIRVYVYVSTCKSSLMYFRSLERFWCNYFTHAGADLETFSMERKIQ